MSLPSIGLLELFYSIRPIKNFSKFDGFVKRQSEEGVIII